MLHSLIAAIALTLCTVAFAAPVRVELIRTDDGFQLLRGGEPYFIKGGGGTDHLDVLAEAGGNSFRTWGHDQFEQRHTLPDGSQGNILDLAHAHGLTVCVGFWMEHPRHGFSYENADDVREQMDEALEFVRAHKDHPAVLMWGVGNEVALSDSPEAVFGAINELAREIKKIDPHHPTMTALAGVWPNQAQLFREMCPDVDIMGVNAYAGLYAVPQELLRQGYDGPYIVTEFGPVGHWESAQTSWGAPVEQSSAGKFRTYGASYEVGIRQQSDRCLGSYAFLWGQKQERTETWYAMFLKTGEKTPSVDAIALQWNGSIPFNRSPMVERIDSDVAMKTVEPGSAASASVLVSDADGDPLSYEWVLKRESTDRRTGGDAESEPPVVETRFETDADGSARFRVPDEPGEYRLFVFVRDGHANAGTANVPFRVP